MSTAPGQLQKRGGSRNLLAVVALLLLLVILIALLVDRGSESSRTSPAGTGSGVAATQARALPPFTGVDLAGANNVVIHAGAKQSVIVHADDNLLGRVTTRVRAGTLVIGITPGSLNAKRPMWVDVSLPTIERLALEGAGNIFVTGIHSRRLSVALSGAGNVEVSGTANRLDVTIGGQGTALLRRLVARDAKATIGGDGTIMLAVTRTLAARISGSGTILYLGNPAHVTQSISGSGTINAG